MARTQNPSSLLKLLACTGLGTAVLWSTLEARDILRGGGSSSPAPATAPAAGSGTTPATAPAVPTASDRLIRTTQALQAVKQMQEAARNLALAGPNNLKTNLPVVPVNSWNKINGLMLATGVPKNLLNPTAGENASLWTGAKLPTVATTGTVGSESTTVTIQQTQQQAVLNWQSFNIGKDTTLNFDQSAGGTNAGQWIAFNKVGVTGSPSQILGSIKAQGQVYVINPNGIIFGGSSQVNTHALVASSLPINDNLIQRGLLNNPDAQFLFSALSLDAGKNGTAAFTPVMVDEFAAPTNTTDVHTFALNPVIGNSPTISYVAPDSAATILKAGDDYTLTIPGADGKMSVSFTTAGLQKKTAGALVQVAYTPTGEQSGTVEVQAGAQLTAPTNIDHVGGRVALIGRNVKNAGTLSTPDGQTILAAGLQVGLAQHASADPTLRGLDVFVGAVTDPAASTVAEAGTVTNDRVVNSDGTIYTGLIDAPRAAVTLTGKTVEQLGFIESSTSVAYNGRVDLVAGYNAVANPKYDPNATTGDFSQALPFLYQSNLGNIPTGDPVANSGRVTLGRDSVLRILPETTSTERTTGDLALPSQVNIQGQSVHFETDSSLIAPGAAVPLNKAFGFDGGALEAGVTIRAGNWFTPVNALYRFVHSDDSQQIYLDQGAVVDVAGSAAVPAAVTENIVSVELRGSELANSPLQRDGPLRGQTIQVDLRQHGPWDQTMNGGLGGYTWVGTPLGNTAGWVGLATHSVGELTVNGGSVALKAGGAVVLQKGSTVDVSGGYIDYQGGHTQTTKLSADGHIYDIAQATPDRKYDSIYTGTTTKTDPKWGVTESNTNPLAQNTYESGYRQGGSGGSVAITSPVMALDGALRGNTVAGPVQRNLLPVYKPASPPDPANPAAVGVAGWLVGALSRPMPAQLSISIGRQYFRSRNGTNNYLGYSPTPANIVFSSSSSLTSVEAFKTLGDYLFPAQRKHELDLSPALFRDDGGGFGIVRIDNSDDALGTNPGFGNIMVKAGTAVTFAPGGSLALSAGNITVENGTSLSAPGGRLSLSAYDISPSAATSVNLIKLDPEEKVKEIPQYNPLRGNVSIGTGSVLNASGVLVDDRVTAAAAGVQPFVTGGGSIVIRASDINLKSGGLLDVSGGAVIGTSGKFTYGDAGSITLESGKDLNSGLGAVVGGRLGITGATLQGYAGVGKKGGTLSLQAPSVVIKDLATTATTATDATTGALSLAPEFFNTGGFASFSATGLGVSIGADGNMTGASPAFTVAPNTLVEPKVQNWESLPGGSTYLAQEGVRKPASLNFKTTGLLKDADDLELGNSTNLVVGAGAVLATDAGGGVSLSGGSVDILGRITARGGAIDVKQSSVVTPFLAGVHLGTASVLDASGAPIFRMDLTGYHKSDVLDGGTIAVAGNLVAEKGAIMDVSGASDTVLVTPGKFPEGLPIGNGGTLTPVVKDSNGGKLTLQGEQVLMTAATLQGTAGGATARSGDLVIISKLAESDFLVRRDNPDNSTDAKPTVNDATLILSSSAPEFVYAGLGKAVTDKAGESYSDEQGLGLVRFGADSFSQGGFGALSLEVGRGALEVQGNVSLIASRQIAVADGGVLSFVAEPMTPLVKPSLTLAAPYVKLGRPFLGPLAPAQQSNPFGANVGATHGPGVLTVHAGSLIDVGTLSLQNAGTVTLDATFHQNQSAVTTGAIRGDGTLDVAGDIVLKAGQIYPPTAVTFNVVASDYASASPSDEIQKGSVTIQAAGNVTPPSLPLSAGGTLNVFASRITQGGTLRAPLGTIRLGADNGSGLNPLSGVSLPVTSTLILQPGSVTSVAALDPATGKPVAIPYGINVNGDTWIDPVGTDITDIGPVGKSVTLTSTDINFQAATTTKAAASIDLAGGGDLSAYQFVPGAGGTVDILGSTAGSFAIVPGYTDAYIPQASYNSDSTNALASDAGYVIGNAKLNYVAGDRIHLEGAGDLPAGDYTLLPARYALLPGAYLVTPQTGATTAGAAPSVTRPDGAVVVAGYRFNGFDAAGRTQSLFRSFEVASQAVVAKRAEYKQYSANTFFTDQAKGNNTAAPRLPVDAGRLGLAAGTALRLQGTVLAKAATGGRGGLIDLSSSADILIGSKTVISSLEAAGPSNTLLLESKQLSSFGAESLLIGGVRTTDDKGTTVTVKTNNIVVDNAGDPLFGPDVILAANQNLTLKDGAEIGKANQPVVTSDPLSITGSAELKGLGDALAFSRGGAAIGLPGGTGAGKLTSTSPGIITKADGTTTPFLATSTSAPNAFTVPVGGKITLDHDGTITFASSTDLIVKSIPLTLGDGTLLRVGSDPMATISRTGVASSTTPVLALGAGVKLAGAGAILDSTNTTKLNEKVDLSAVNALALHSDRVSLLLDQPGAVATAGSLVLSRAAQELLLKSASSLSLLSYSTLDIYGTGTFGSSTLGSLALHAGAIRGYPNSVDPAAGVTVKAKAIALDNAGNAAAPSVVGTPDGTLTFDTGTLQLGGNQLQIQNFSKVAINASGGVLTGDTAKLSVKNGGLNVLGGDLSIKTPLITGASTTNQSIAAEGLLTLSSSSGVATVSPGLGAKLAFTGKTVDVGTVVRLPSGTLTMEARAGNLSVAGGTLDVGGTAQHFYEVTKYTDGGRIALSAAGDMTIASGSKVLVAADAGGGSAGTLDVSVPLGSFSIAADTLWGQAGRTGQGGAFSLDTVGLPGADSTASHLATLNQALVAGGFDRSVAVRVREGNVVADGTIRAHEIALAADKGKITVTGTLDASGFIGSNRADPFGGSSAVDPAGGKINLNASGDVVLTKDAWLTAAGYAYSNAGKGGAIVLSAGSYNGLVDTTAKVEIQDGAQLDLGVKNRFTPNDLLLNPDMTLPVSNRTDFFTGTLHLRESQTTFGNGAQFNGIGGSIHDASSIVLEGFQVFDLTKTDGTVSTTGAITSIGSSGLIDSTVQKMIKDNGTAFIGGVNPALLGNNLIHVQPGAEIVNNGSATNTLVTLYASNPTTGSSVGLSVPKATTVTIPVPGGIFPGDTIKLSASGAGLVFTVNFANGSSVAVTSGQTFTASAADPGLVKSITFQNTSASTARTGTLLFSAGSVPFAVVVPAGVTPILGTTNKPTSNTTTAGDLVLANTWDLSGYRFGPKLEPGNLTLRAKGNLVFGFDASLNDGFDPTNPIAPADPGDPTYPLWLAQLRSDRSWAYRLVAGADYGAADSQSVQPLGLLAASSGSLLLGQGAPLPLPPPPGSTVTRASFIPRYFQTIRTGTGDIDIVAGRDVQFLNPLATIYTAGRWADPLANFDVPVLDSTVDSVDRLTPYYSAQYSLAGGDVSIHAQNDIARYVLSGTSLIPNSSKELPSNWLYRRGNVGLDGKFVAFAGTETAPLPPSTEIQSTSWWIDFSNFFSDVGTLGGGDVSLAAGRNVSNVNAAAPTNARMPGKNADSDPVAPDATKLVEFGGGDVAVRAGADIDGGVYYVERGAAVLRAGAAVKTNATRLALAAANTNPVTWLPTTFFLGKGRIDVAAGGDVRLGAVANPFWQPQGAGNRLYETTYFSTFDPHNDVKVASLGGAITLQAQPDTSSGASLVTWYTNVMSLQRQSTAASQPWLLLGPKNQQSSTPVNEFKNVAGVLPASYRATAFAGDIDIVGLLTLAPSPVGSLDLLAAGNINGLRVNGVSAAGSTSLWGSAAITLSDADPTRLPSITKPISNPFYATVTPDRVLSQIDALFAEAGGTDFSLEEKLALHGQTTDASGKLVPLHYADTEPLRLYAVGGDLSGLTLYSAKSARVIAQNDLSDLALYVQNVRAGDNTVVAAGHDIIAYDPASPLRLSVQKSGSSFLSFSTGDTGPAGGAPTAGDIQIAGPGTLEVLAGRDLELGSGSSQKKDGTAVGITSVGATRNPYLPQNSGAGIVAVAGVGSVYTSGASAVGQTPGLASTSLKLAAFVAKFLDPNSAGAQASRYLPALGKLMELTSTDANTIWNTFGFKPDQPLSEQQAGWVIQLFNRVLRDSARDRNDFTSPDFGTYTNGFTAIESLFPGSPSPTKEDIESTVPVARPSGPWTGDLSMATRLIKTFEGGDITLLIPGGDITVGRATDPQKPDQGILTQRGGGISIFAADSVNVGTSRIFTLRGGNEILWSTWGNIAAGSGSKTVFSAPPTRVLVDPQSGDVQNDLAGLATGSGIGVLATLSGVKPGDVDLIAPVGTIDAGDAGIRSSGNLNIAARVVLNASNIQVGGSTAGTPPPPPAPNLGSLSAASTASAGASSAATDVAKQNTASNQTTVLPSMITVEVLGYGGGDEEEEEDKKKTTEAAEAEPVSP